MTFLLDEARSAHERRESHLDSIDLKASFLAAGLGALLAGIVVVAATRPPQHLAETIAMLVTSLLAWTGLAACGWVWKPRDINSPPDTTLLVEAIEGDELTEKKDLLGAYGRAHERFLGVEHVKRKWVRRATMCLLAAGLGTVFIYVFGFVWEVG